MMPVYHIKRANPYPLGVRKEGHTIFASMISEVEDCGVLLYNNEEEEAPLKIFFPADQHIGLVYSMAIEGVPAYYTKYRLFKGEEILADTHGRCFEKRAYGAPVSEADMFGIFGGKAFEWQNDQKPDVSYSEAVFYGLHVRGFTMDESSKCRYRGTFKGVSEKLDYVKDLGITSLILMPAYEFLEQELPVTARGEKKGQAVVSKSPKQSLNYWGYKKGFYYAPKAAYAAGADACLEMKELVKHCHEKGLELFMQFYFPQDVLEPEILRILEYWVEEYHIDGFQILAEHINIDLIRHAPILADTKLIFCDFQDTDDISRSLSNNQDVLKQTSSKQDFAGQISCRKTKRLCIYREDTMRDYRRFIRGEEYALEAVMYHFRKNGRNVAYLNSIADYQGFRLADLVSYDYKHNEANGEHNQDGSNYNYSWNCGEEGATKNSEIIKLRKRQMKNALCMIFLSQGTPYLFMGDEMGQSQQGNNNPYNQDNEISWLHWENLLENKEIFLFLQELIAYRKAHPILHRDEPMHGTDMLCCGYPDLSFHGLEAYRPLSEPYRKELGILLCGKYAYTYDKKEDKTIYIACNMHNVQHIFTLPKLEKGLVWKLVLKTSDDALFSDRIAIPPNSIAVLEVDRL